MINFPLKYKNSPDILYEDIYLFDEVGDVILSRCSKDTGISNIFALLSKEDEFFVREGSKSYEIRPFILTDSRIGPIFIARSFFPSFRVLFAIVPHFEREEIFAIAQRAVPAGVCPTDSCAETLKLREISDIELKDEHIAFGKLISDCFYRVKFYRSESMSNAEVSEHILEKTSSFSSLFGCLINVSFDRSFFDIQGAARFSMELFLLSLVCFCFASRYYSADRSFSIVFFGHESGSYVEAYFEICSDFAGSDITKKAVEFNLLEAKALQHNFIYDLFARKDFIYSRLLPWETDPRGLGLKTKPKFDCSDDTDFPRTDFVLNKRR